MGYTSRMGKTIFGILALLLVGVGVWYALYGGGSEPQPDTTVGYVCNDGKAIVAAYFNADSATPPVASGTPPTPGGSVRIALSDGRSMELAQTISASGIRYASEGEEAVFWSKGNGAFLLENNTQTYAGCIRAADDPGGLGRIYENGSAGFSIRHPADYAVDAAYRYEALGPGNEIGGVKFTISTSTSEGTNLSSDSYLSVEEIPGASTCSASLFLPDGASESTIEEDGTSYSFAEATGAAAGNRYEESVYAIPGTNPCIAVRYMIHYGVLENYEPGTVEQFDETALKKTFDAMRSTLVIGQ